MPKMPQAGYQEGGERVWWWKVALHLDEAQLAAVNAMAHNVDDPSSVHALQDKLREAQALLLEIFHRKGLLPGALNGNGQPPLPPFLPQPLEAADNAVEISPNAAMAPPLLIVTDDVPLDLVTEPEHTPERTQTASEPET